VVSLVRRGVQVAYEADGVGAAGGRAYVLEPGREVRPGHPFHRLLFDVWGAGRDRQRHGGGGHAAHPPRANIAGCATEAVAAFTTCCRQRRA